METKTIENKVTEPKKELRFYILIYFQGTHQNWFIFSFLGGLRDAINEGRRHCEVMHYRFGSVRPGIVDLSHREKTKLSDPDWNDSQDYVKS